jgi:hypothetical protein
MNLTRKALTTLGGVLLVALLIAALAPQAARGVAAALVQITNTTANPVPNRDVDNGPRQAVTLLASGTDTNNIAFEQQNANGLVYVVPAGKRLVVEFISGRFTTPAGGHILSSIIFGNNANGDIADELSPNLVTAGNFNVFMISQPMRAYYDAGTSLRVVVVLTSGTFAASPTFTLHGYLVDCTGACM